MASTNKYASVMVNLNKPVPSWVTDTDDQQRVGAYDGYDDMYKNVPGTFKLAIHGSEDKPIYVPSAKRVVEAVNRYLGKSWSWAVMSVNPDQQQASADQSGLTSSLLALFTREEMLAKIMSLKRNMVKRGDALFHITANGSLPAGSRLSIEEIHPRTYFRIPDAGNAEVLAGCYIVDLVFADDGKTQVARRQEYRYNEDGTVFTRITFWEANGWDDRWIGHPALKPVATPTAYKTPAFAQLLAGFDLPASVRTIPVYHYRNDREGGEPFGTSVLAGMETLVAGINQTVSDEDISLALQGLGVYVTDSARPVDDNGTEMDWIVAPGTVLEMRTGAKFDRLQGITSVQPYGDHFDRMTRAIDSSAGLSAVAVGNVDVSIASSGIALRLDMAPILAANAEREVELLSRLDQMFFDLLTMWFPVDGTPVPSGMAIANAFDDPLPVDRAATVNEVVQLVNAQLMSREFAIAYLTAKLGYQFPVGMLDQILSEQDNVAERIAAEAAGAGVPTVLGPDTIGTGTDGAISTAPGVPTANAAPDLAATAGVPVA